MPALYANPIADIYNIPLSPPTDFTSNLRYWGKILQKLTESSGSNTGHGIESDVDIDNRSDSSDSGIDNFSDTSLSDMDLFNDPMEETLRRDVVDLIACCLIEAKDCGLNCSKLLIPDKLLEHISLELLHLAASEPCGLRGAQINVCVERGDICQSMEQIAVDPHLVPTFQLTLVLRLDSEGLWPKIQGLFATKTSTPAMKHALRLSNGFRVIKKKLYSSEELIIEEC